MDKHDIAVLGAGSWGTALANLLAHKGQTVRVWAREPEVVESINLEHMNGLFLPDAPLAPALTATGDVATACKGASVIVSAAPSHAVRAVIRQAAPSIRAGSLVVSVSKGLEPESLITMSRVLADELKPEVRVAVLSGPSFAREVYDGQPTAVVAAAAAKATATEAQRVFATSHFRVYSHTDVIGVELGGALKNVVAIAAGLLHGLGLGQNPLAALITRGLAEITRLGVAMGADPLTFAGLAGLGDLVLTATGRASRNRSLGVEVARGRSVRDILAERVSVAEGVKTAQSAVTLARRHNVELPIAEKMEEILFQGKDVRAAMAELMERELKPEQWQ